jgi:hypothetical protein
MIFRQCTHPHTTKIVFDIGNEQIAEYLLCKNCKEIPIFKDFIISKEVLPDNTQVTEIEGQDRLNSISVMDGVNTG